MHSENINNTISICSICRFEIDDNLIILHNCMHKFCKDCITQWIRSGKTNCPNCRTGIHELDYSACEITYRAEYIQGIIAELIDYHNEELVQAESEYTELLKMMEMEDSTQQLFIEYSLTKFSRWIHQDNLEERSRQQKICNFLREHSQDDMDVVNTITDLSPFHEIILQNYNQIINMQKTTENNIKEVNDCIENYNKTRKSTFERYYNNYSRIKESIETRITDLKNI